MKWMVQSVFLLMLSFSVNEAMAQNPTMTITQDLSFGTNITGTRTIAYNASTAAAFSIQFPNYSQSGTLSLTFILPSDLTDDAGDNLPISFAANSAAYHVGVNSTRGATTFNPNNGLNGTLGRAAHTDYFWLGGTVTPGINYTASTYTGTITVLAVVTIGTQQYNASQTITATATLTGNVSMSVTGSLDFGLVVAGTTPPSLSAQSGTAPSITTSVTHGGGGQITVTYSPRTVLNDPYGNTLTFTPSLFGSNVAGNQAGATAVTSGSSLTLSGRRNQTGYYYFWLGGALNPVPNGQQPGTYSGNFVLSVTYP